MRHDHRGPTFENTISIPRPSRNSMFFYRYSDLVSALYSLHPREFRPWHNLNQPNYYWISSDRHIMYLELYRYIYLFSISGSLGSWVWTESHLRRIFLKWSKECTVAKDSKGLRCRFLNFLRRNAVTGYISDRIYEFTYGTLDTMHQLAGVTCMHELDRSRNFLSGFDGSLFCSPSGLFVQGSDHYPAQRPRLNLRALFSHKLISADRDRSFIN